MGASEDFRLERITALCAALPEVTRALRGDHADFYLPAHTGARGWFGLRLDKGRIDWREVENILQLSYCLAAPRGLAALVEQRLAR